MKYMRLDFLDSLRYGRRSHINLVYFLYVFVCRS
jgi:hypothetical protein